MNRKKTYYLFILLLLATTLACSISGISRQVRSVEETAQTLRTDVSGIITAGDSLIVTAQAIETQHPDVLETVKAFTTQGPAIINTIQAAATNNPGLVQTAQAFIEQEIPTGEPPADIPIYELEQVENFFGSSQYIFYISPGEYPLILEFYKTQMPSNGWQFLESDSHEFSNAAQLNYFKDNRIATINISENPLNNTTVIIISTGT
jgi:hypothetical protein